MKNSDFIKMTQCHIYGVTFPTENLVEILEKATFEHDFVTVEMVKNPITGNIVHQLNGGLFFSMRITYRVVNEALISNKIYELKQSQEYPNASDKDLYQIAKMRLFHTVPASSEIVNLFYSTEHKLLFINKGSKNARVALSVLIRNFDLLGVKSVVISDEKLGLHTKLEAYLKNNEPLFKFLHFQNEATLKKVENGDESFLTCRHLDLASGREKALAALKQGFQVQSLVMAANDGEFCVDFKLDRRLKVRSMKFKEAAEISRLLNGNKQGKPIIFQDYLQQQFDALVRIAKCTALEFMTETKPENFI